uniref:Uncharacterized protein n=1 Tax=Quercus lobata TaxID=97700 RepID=A0A7N2MKN2_QUELO
MGKYGVNVKVLRFLLLMKSERRFRVYFPMKARKEDANFDSLIQLVVKSQILAGGRGLGTFKSGLKGGVHIVKADQVEDIAGKMLGQILVTKQTGPQGKVVSKVYLCEKLSLVNETYFAITLDRNTAGPVPIDVFTGITDEDAAKVVDGLAPTVADRKDSIEQVKKLYELFCKCDCTLLEINPIAETADKQLVAADAKLNFDDNAAFCQKEIFALHDPSQEDPQEVAAAKADLNYIGLDGEIGCMVVEAFKILTSDDKVKAILVNIFGGIMKCNVIASGIVNAAKQVTLKVPVVVCLEGTNVDQGKRTLKESGLALITADDLDDAAEKAVKAYK